MRLFLRSLLIIFLATENAQAAPELFSKVVASAGDQIITSREVVLNRIIENLIFSKKTEPLEDVTSVLLEWIVFLEAKSFNYSDLGPSEIKINEKSLTQKLAGSPYDSLWKKLSPSAKEVEEMLDRKMRSKKFIQFKISSTRIPVTDAEALSYFQTHKNRFGDAPFSQFKEQIKTVLAKQQSDDRIKDWFALLQKKHKVRKISSGTP